MLRCTDGDHDGSPTPARSISSRSLSVMSRISFVTSRMKSAISVAMGSGGRKIRFTAILLLIRITAISPMTIIKTHLGSVTRVKETETHGVAY